MVVVKMVYRIPSTAHCHSQSGTKERGNPGNWLLFHQLTTSHPNTNHLSGLFSDKIGWRRSMWNALWTHIFAHNITSGINVKASNMTFKSKAIGLSLEQHILERVKMSDNASPQNSMNTSWKSVPEAYVNDLVNFYSTKVSSALSGGPVNSTTALGLTHISKRSLHHIFPNSITCLVACFHGRNYSYSIQKVWT